MSLGFADSSMEASPGFELVVWLMETARAGSVTAWAIVRVMARRIASRRESILCKF